MTFLYTIHVALGATTTSSTTVLLLPQPSTEQSIQFETVPAGVDRGAAGVSVGLSTGTYVLGRRHESFRPSQTPASHMHLHLR
jgi:hypothetical protein